uniref:ARAD1B08536p n=1 Tax=Blastobotrys adeninivorans TaxID=409370 RepID=A0A060TAP8_BLAAD
MAQSVSLLTPLLYIGVLLTALVVFSSVYRRRKIRDLASIQPWYPYNYSKEIYLSLRDNAGDQKVPDKLLKAALVKWAAEDIRQLLRMRESKQVLQGLHQKGSVGDDIWRRLTASEKMVELEINSLAAEANSLKEGWAQQMFQTATEVTQNESIRKRLEDFPKQQAEFREAWEKVSKANLEDLTDESPDSTKKSKGKSKVK